MALRDAGRKLSGTRDADVMVEALDDLSERYAGQLPKRTFTAMRDSLQAQQQSARRFSKHA